MNVNIFEAKTELSKLVHLVESGNEEVYICRYNKPVAKLVRYNDTPVKNRIGIAKGKLKSPADLDMDNDKIAEFFGIE